MEKSRGAIKFIRAVLLAMAAVFLMLQMYYAFKPNGSLTRYRLSETFKVMADISLSNPVMAGAFIDLMTLMATVALLVLFGTPKGKQRIWITAGLLMLTVVYPALALIVFLLCYWRRIDQFATSKSDC